MSMGERPTFSELVAVFARIGLISFGGPAGQIALMHRVVVEERRWIAEDRYLAALNACMLLPGPEAQQLATWIGWRLHGIRGGLAAGLLFILPGFLIVTGLAALYADFGDLPAVSGAFDGLKAAVLAIVLEALLRIARRALKTWTAVLTALAAFSGIFLLSLPFPLIVAAAGLFGFLAGRRTDDRPPTVANAGRPAALDSLRAAAIWTAVWASLPLAVLIAAGSQSIFARLAGFFSTMAVVTFGGAYAVLAYVADAAVTTYGWLSAGEMLDALALAETTPGPLILVLVFIGFLAGHRQPLPLDPLTGGLLGALVTAWVTFAPSFLWIFVGAPHLDRLLAAPRLKAALASVTAAVVGVIANLSLWFALHVLFRTVERVDIGPLTPTLPDPTSLDPLAFGLAALSAGLIFIARSGVLPTLGIAAVLGWAASAAGLSG